MISSNLLSLGERAALQRRVKRSENRALALVLRSPNSLFSYQAMPLGIANKL